ncbi:hypothetical protein IFM89_027739 [Coptis chinensis]|uniref:Uncharacterized protein n=1 Tax=Coptis chinensis TaxID=261450 RepID=A0A835HTK1_9MAGN|nr:hypothetical protein IFM89_027739 [Coptis chinensis]
MNALAFVLDGLYYGVSDFPYLCILNGISTCGTLLSVSFSNYYYLGIKGLMSDNGSSLLLRCWLGDHADVLIFYGSVYMVLLESVQSVKESIGHSLAKINAPTDLNEALDIISFGSPKARKTEDRKLYTLQGRSYSESLGHKCKLPGTVGQMSTDAAESESDLLQSLTMLNGRTIPLVKRPARNSVEKWDALL